MTPTPEAVDVSAEAVEMEAAALERMDGKPHAVADQLRALRLALTARDGEVRELREMLLEVANCLADNAAQCKDLHHPKADQHEGHMACPVEGRIGAVEVRARAILAKEGK